MTEPKKRFNKKNHINILSLAKDTNEPQSKCVYVKINNTNVNLHLDTGSNISTTNTDAWKKPGDLD